MHQYNVNGFKFATEKYSKNKKTNNSGVWVKGDDGNQNENIDYFGVLHEILELEYSGWPIKRIVLFQCKWFDPTSRGTREFKQHNIIEVKHTRKYEAYDPFIIAQNAKQDEEETFEEDEWIDEEETSEDDACEWIDDEETSEEDE
ncbi:hypothetical protein R3W88_014709 [Solanum pinnatisectum]|uniref:DUF4216 domain-containing protein n=1 Tax=Solanum pinnatisectum TaxID=50273 RepID=A0AAV9KT07_9SOLN|nr:hypothetical protein R3W88_014709 [Solanum pinnatisectum]